MILVALSIALLTGNLPGDSNQASATPVSLPDAPTTQVLDRMEWLNDERREALESELGRLKEEHDVDIYVVIWDRRLPDGKAPEDLATELGEWWSDGQLWGTVLLTPEAINRPIAITGGKNLDDQDRDHLASAASYSIDFGARAWTDQGRLEQTALTLAEELIFARQQMTIEAEPPSGPAAVIAKIKSKDSAALPLLLAAIGTILLLLLALLLKRHFERRNVQAPEQAPLPEPRPEPQPEPLPEPLPATFTFPSTVLEPRLGASWSGGSSLVAIVTSPPTS